MRDPIPQAILDIAIPEDAEDYSFLPTVNCAKDVGNLLQPLYVIHNFMETEAKYRELIESIHEIIMASFELEECRTYPVKFKFYPRDKEIHTLELRHFLVNLWLWFPLLEVYAWDDVMNEEFIMDCSKMNKNNLNKYLDKYAIKVLIKYNIKGDLMNRRVAETIHNLSCIASETSSIMMCTFSLETFLKMYRDNERYRELFNTEYPSTMQPVEIEQDLDIKTNECIEMFKADPKNPIGMIFRSGTGIKPKQFGEFTISEGLIPDINGKTIPIPINTNTLKGRTKPSEHMIAASGARKSQILNDKVMGKAGYFGKIVTLMALNKKLSTTTFDCETRHLVPIFIKDKKWLSKYDARYYRTDDDPKLRVLDADIDTDLIGKRIYVRSPETCCCEDGVCMVCYGKNAVVAWDIPEGVAGYGAQEITKVVEQNILSAKHLLSTNSEEIVFNDEFNKFFSLVADEITINLDSDIDASEWGIFINPDDISREDEMDDDSTFNTTITSGVFYMKNLKDGSMIAMHSAENKELYPSAEIINKFSNRRGGKDYVPLADLEEGQSIFEIDIMNNELTKPLYDIMALLNKKDDSGKEYTVGEITEYFVSLLIQSGINAKALQAELILSCLIREKDNLMNVPDFSRKHVKPYKFLTVRDGIGNLKSPLIHLAYQDNKKHLLRDSTFDSKHEASYMDEWFKKSSPTRMFKT